MAVDRSRNSHAYENMLEHVFLAEVLRHMWYERQKVVEVAKAQVDSWGYDVVLAVDGTTRYVQLKTSLPATVQERLAARPGGCVVAVLPNEDATQVAYRVWEADAEVLRKMPAAKSTVYKRNKIDREARTGHRLVNNRHFEPATTVAGLCKVLFP